MSERRPKLLISIAAGAATLGIVAGMAAYVYFRLIPSREAGDVVSSAKVIPNEAWIVGLLSTDPNVRAQLEKLANSQSNNVAIVPPLLRSTDSIAGIPIPREFLGTPKPRQISSQRRASDPMTGMPIHRESLGTPKPRRIISQRRASDSMTGMPIHRESLGTPKPRQTISHGRQKFTRSIQRQIEECNV
jgi:hypothetical protein